MVETETKTASGHETWQVMTPEGVFDADLQTLKQWIVEGAVHPTDKVRKGSLKWIDAGRAPMLRRVFNGEETPAPPDASAGVNAVAQHQPVAATQATPASDAQAHAVSSDAQTQSPSSGAHAQATTPGAYTQTVAGVQTQNPAHAASLSSVHQGQELGGAPPLNFSCHFHRFEEATLVCRACQTTLCRACPKQVGASSVFLCPLCGGFCDPLKPIIERQALYEFQGAGFGFADFAEALRYPFKHFASLLGGALLYGFLMLAGLRGQLVAWGIIYGCITLVIHRVAYGRLDRDFMPDFADFSIWDDVVRPAFLGLGVTLVTLGPILLLVAALVFGWVGGGARPQVPDLTPQRQALEQPDDVDASGGVATAEGEAARNDRQQRALEQLQKQIEAQSAKARQEQDDRDGSAAMAVIRQLMAHPGLIFLLALLSFAWAIFYHPVALIVAGWTDSFKSTINPLVGLDTIRHLGVNYLKAFLMYVAVQVVGFVIQVVVALVTAPFDMPLVGNLPGKFVGGVFTFYTSLVIACVLGLALFKSADRFGIEIG